MSKLKVGTVYQMFTDGSISGPYILKKLPWEGYTPGDYWYNRVNLYTMQDIWSHIASIKTLRNDKPISSQASKEEGSTTIP